MKILAAIALALLLAGCTANDQLLLQQDLKRLADLPKQMGNAGSGASEEAPATAAASPAPETVPKPALVEPPLVQAEQAPASPSAETAPPQQMAASTRKPKPTLFDALGVTAPPPPAGPPGAYDQIPDPIPVENPLARPPWEVFMEAGPNAHKELDLETLYGPGHIPPDMQAKEEAEQQQLLDASGKTKAEQQLAAREEAAQLAEPPPGDAEAEPAPDVTSAPEKKVKADKAEKPGVAIKAVAVPVVKGAKGKGNGELTRAMRNALTAAGWPVLEGARKDALTVRGKVTLGPHHGATQSVRIVWDVLTPDGKSLGNLKQDNAVPAGSLDQSWGDNAGYAAEAAAEGIFKLIQKYR